MSFIIIILKFLAKNFVLTISIVVAFYRLFVMYSVMDPTLVFLNIGQGDAIFIQQDSFQMLVDTGPDDSILYELPKFMPANDRSIEIVLLTHSHDDHIQGIFSILNNYDVGKIIYTSKCFKSKDFDYIQANYKDSIYDLTTPWSLKYDDISIYSYPFDTKCHQNTNEDSIVLQLDIGETRTLLMGDAGYEVEEYLLENNLIGQVDILKTGHHCSRSATGDMFLSRIFPSISICSCGKENSFGHPHSETIDIFKKYSVQYLITYQEGNIVFKFKK